MPVILADRDHPLRPSLERMVREVFLTQYGARIPAFPDRLVASLSDGGKPLAVAGLRFAPEGLFSEAYLDAPVEEVLSAAIRRPVARTEIVEFSSLAAPYPGAAMPLVGAAIRLCLSTGAAYGVFTATSRLRLLLRRTGLICIDLGPARAERMAHAGVWGSYYRHDPRVLAAAADTLAGVRPVLRPEPCHA